MALGQTSTLINKILLENSPIVLLTTHSCIYTSTGGLSSGNKDFIIHHF